MRLLYVYLPDYGPLKEVAVVFEQNPHIVNRQGAVNFVVGLNGSGKSSLLRALYDVFQSLSRAEVPKFPVTLAYHIQKGGDTGRTVIFHRPRGPASQSVFVPLPEVPKFASAAEWQHYIEQMIVPNKELHYATGDRLKGDGNVQFHLPTRVLAYTSGDVEPWQAMAYPSAPADELPSEDSELDRLAERPMGWTRRNENQGQPQAPLTRVRDITTAGSGTDDEDDLADSDNPEDNSADGDRCLLLRPDDARLAATVVGIWQAALDLEPRSQESQRETFRKERIAELDNKTPVDGARRILNELDWLWPTHAGFRFTGYADAFKHPDNARCYWLLALAEAVIAHPLSESLAVVPLGNRSSLRPEELVGDTPLEETLKVAGEPMRNARCGAEALRALLAGEREPHESLWSMFHMLRNWRNLGLLNDVQLTVKRIRQVPAANGELDDRILTYASFSDGEQMLLGRMALLILLRKQDNSLLLLDEPETHFNDTWKRQIIDMVDDSILKDTTTHVLVSTHTSLALTDVFSCEITRLVKEKGVVTAQTVPYPTFGADPGRILLHVFGAPDVIGARAAEFLRSKLDPAKWPPEDREKLKLLIDEIGSGWPRAKLMEILEKLESPDASRSS
jgi:ABC-type hemin transport system ATPase subunit